MRWLSDPELMARWILGADRAETANGHVRLSVATTVARQRIAATYTGEIVERTPERFIRRYLDDHGEVSIDRTITYELARTPAGCELTCSVITDVEGISASVVRASRRLQKRSLQRSLRRLAALITGRQPTGWARYVDRRQTGQPL